MALLSLAPKGTFHIWGPQTEAECMVTKFAHEPHAAQARCRDPGISGPQSERQRGLCEGT